MTILGKMGDILVPTFFYFELQGWGGGRDIADNSRPLSLDFKFEILGMGWGGLI